MASITTRAGKGSPLTNAEVDANFTNLNTELGQKLIASSNLSDLASTATARTNLGLAIGTNVQAWDADLDAIGALAGTAGLLRKTAANTWSLDTATYLTGNQSISLSGDATGSGTTSIALTLANSGVTAGTYTKLTVDAKGRVTVGASLASADLPTYTGTLTSTQVTTALGFTPYNSTNPNGYTSNTGTVTSVSGTGTVSGLTLTGTVTGSGSLTLGGAITGFLPSTGGSLTGSLNFSGTGLRITGDFSDNVTQGNRVMFQTSTVNGATVVSAMPNGTSTTARWVAFGGSDPSNASSLQLSALGTEVRITSNANGTASVQPLNLYMGITQALNVSTAGVANFLQGLQQGGNQVLHAGNYNSYSPTLTGAGASGTWGISISGNAATVTNGVYTNTAQVIAGLKQFNTSNTGMANSAGNLANVEAYGTGGAAMIGFHRPGVYAAYFGLDSDNVWKVGGWSMGAVAYPILHSNNYTSYSPSLTGTGASGTWGISITGSAATLGGKPPQDAVGANTIPTRDGSGYVYFNYINSNTGNGENPTVSQVIVTNGSDGFYRKASIAHLTSSLSGTAPINISGSAGSVSGLTLNNSGAPINPDNVTQNQIGYNTNVSLFSQTDGGLYSSAYSSSWIHQIYGDFRTGQIAIRGKNNGTWQAWRTVLDSSNYTSYAPSLTGSGASGTWGINVTGTASYSNNLARGFNSNWNTDFSDAPAGSTILRGDTSSGSSTGGPGGTWWFQQNMRHSNSSNVWGVQVAWGWEDNANILRTRNVTGNIYGSWVTYLNSSNYTSYSPSLTGSGASGTWSINVTGSAGSATTATTATTANALNTGNNYQVNSLGVGTAASGTSGEIRATNNITAYYSDDRLKTRLGAIENALDKVASLESFYYEANETAQGLGYEPVREVGISAQQVQAVLPEVVAPAPIDDKYLTVRYERMVPLLIAAINELRVEVAALKGAH